MMQTTTNDAGSRSRVDAARMAEYSVLIARLPITMRPSLNQQLSEWDTLFPFEQNQMSEFLRGLESLQPQALDALVQPLKALEARMGVEHWNFSEAGDTMENASLLARSEFYADWRRQVQRIFDAVNSAARPLPTEPNKDARLILIILPESLPVDAMDAWKPWDKHAHVFKINGDARRVSELLIQGEPDQPGIAAVLAQEGSADRSDLWLIDAEAKLNELLPVSEREAGSALSYSVLKPFRDKFLAEVNTVPKSIEATDHTLSSMRHRDWGPWWPTEFAGQALLRSFVVDLFLSGNGALIFSNAFVEWAASEALRRARPRAIVSRFGLRAKPKPFTGIAIFENQHSISTLPDVDDPQGSATDALILARYIWLAALRYPEYEKACCICISEYRNSIYLVAPSGTPPPWDPDHPVSPVELSTWLAARFAT